MLVMRYGFLLIVREIGGFRDIVIFYNKFIGEGNGFSFKNYNVYEMFFCLKNVIKVFKDKEKWIKLVENVMKIDNSWKKLVKEYIEIYRDICD